MSNSIAIGVAYTDQAISGGTIDGSVIGGTTAAAITGTTINGTTITASSGFVGPVLSAAPINVTATTLAVTGAAHGGRVVTLNRAAGIAVTMPAATGTGTSPSKAATRRRSRSPTSYSSGLCLREWTSATPVTPVAV